MSFLLTILMALGGEGPAELITFTSGPGFPNGAWCWYQDERVIVDVDRPEGPLLLLGAVSFSTPGDEEHGDLDVLWYEPASGERGAFELHDRFEPDDHDVPALHIRGDGRYLAVYSMHSTDKKLRWRVSERPHDPTAWGPEQTYTNDVHVCYSNVFATLDVEGDEVLYDFARSNGFDPNYFVSRDDGTTWSYGGKLMTGPEGNEAHYQRPYVKYGSSADGREVHFITTEGHPHDEDNGIYHGFLRDGKLFLSDGSEIGPLSATSTSPYWSPLFTTVLAPGEDTADSRMHHAWTIDLHVDEKGRPFALFQARAKKDQDDHRFFQGRWNGKQWKTVELAQAGGPLYAEQRDYTGLGALHPHDPDVLFISTPVDPRNDEPLAHHEIFMGRTRNGGTTWKWTPVTWSSEVDNLRPVVPVWDAEHTAVLWLQGTITSYRDWDSQIVGKIVRTDELEALAAPTR